MERLGLKKEHFDNLSEDHPYWPIACGLREGTIKNLMFVPQGGDEAWEVPDGPTVISIGDDLDCAMGPGAFHRPSLLKALRKCGGFVLQVADFQPEIMRAIAFAATINNVMIIETREDREIEWMTFLEAEGANQFGAIMIVTTRNGCH